VARLLIVYGTTDGHEGQTAKIAEHIGARLEHRGHDVTVRARRTRKTKGWRRRTA